MKHIIICFDGTWNRIDADHPTNVLKLATGIAPSTSDGIKQVIHYDEGVGTSGGLVRKLVDGAFGRGLLRNLAEAYRFLMFNYDPEDKVYVFGFSRGAYTARSFVGLVRSVGILQRHHARQVKRAIRIYKRGKGYESLDMLNFRAKYSMHISTCGADEAHRRSGLFGAYRPGSSMPFKFRYVGIWDTVETIGLPQVIWATLVTRVGRVYRSRRHRYHDHEVNKVVAAGRHAVALDERRVHFHSEPWGDIDSVNERLGFEADFEESPLQEKFFAGDHGSVGGGGDITGLSDGAFDWVLQGARDAGLELDKSATSSLYAILPDYRAPLKNTSKPKRFDILGILKRDRSHKPARLQDVHESARRRWHHGDTDGNPYATVNLQHLSAELNALEYPDPYDNKAMTGLQTHLDHDGDDDAPAYEYHTIIRNETLGSIAADYLGSASHWQELHEMNAGLIVDPDKIYVGQVIRVPIRGDDADPSDQEPED